MGRTSGEVMVKRGKAAVSRAIRVVAVAMTRSRVIGRAGWYTAMTGNDIVFAGGGLPIDWVETLVELLGAGELPLAENCPKNGKTSHRSSNGNENGQGHALCLCNAGQGSYGRGVFGWIG